MSTSKFLALITGGAQGFGREFTKKLLSQGGRVAILDVDHEAAGSLLTECHNQYGKESTYFFPCDVTDFDQLNDCFQKCKEVLGGLNIVCNNAGIAVTHEPEKSKQDNYRSIATMINLNLTAVVNGTHLGVEQMSVKNGGSGGQVVNVASMAGLVAFGGGAEYAATKHGVVGFTRSLRGVLAQDQVRVNCLCPQFVETNLVKNAMKESSNEIFKESVIKQGLMPIEMVTDAFFELIQDETKDGACIAVTNELGIQHVKLSVKFLTNKL